MSQLQIIHFVQEAFRECDPVILNRVWLSLQGCMKEIVKVNGGNNCKLPHMNKACLERENRLPITLNVAEEVEMPVAV